MRWWSFPTGKSWYEISEKMVHHVIYLLYMFVYITLYYLCRHNISMPYQDVFFWREFNSPSSRMGCWWSQIHGFIVFNAAREMTGDGMGSLYPCLKWYQQEFVVRPFLPFFHVFFPWNMGVSPIGSLPLKQSHMTSMVVAHPNQSTTPKHQPTKKHSINLAFRPCSTNTPQKFNIALEQLPS